MALVPVRPHLRSWPGTARRRKPGFDFLSAVAEELDRAERGEKTERELLRDAALVQDPAGDLARRLDAFAAGVDDAVIKKLRAALAAGRGTNEGSYS